MSDRPESQITMINGRWQPASRPLVVPSLKKNTPATTSMRTIQIIDPSMVPAPPTSSLKHMQSAQNLFSIGKRMPEVEMALKQLVANMETCPRPEEEAPQPLSLRNVTLHGYQRHALAWMHWREINPPFGGNKIPYCISVQPSKPDSFRNSC